MTTKSKRKYTIAVHTPTDCFTVEMMARNLIGLQFDLEEEFPGCQFDVLTVEQKNGDIYDFDTQEVRHAS